MVVVPLLLILAPMRRNTAVLLISLIFGGTAIGSAWWFAHSRPAPDVVLKITDGRELALRSLAGRPVLVIFWASTCGQCREDMPLVSTLYRELAPRGLEIIAVAMFYDRPDHALAVAAQYGLPYPVAIDVEAKAAHAFGKVHATPTAFLIAPDGHIALQATGPLPVTAVRNQIRAWLDPRPAG
jgi:peroxiredoxin